MAALYSFATAVKTEANFGPQHVKSVKIVKTMRPHGPPRQIRQSGETARQNHRPLRTPTTTVGSRECVYVTPPQELETLPLDFHLRFLCMFLYV